MAGKTKKAIKEQRFVDEYLVDNNGTRAAIAAGYSAKTAPAAATQLLNRPKVKELLAEACKAMSARTAITADKVIGELAKLGFSNMLDYAVIDPIDGSLRLDLSAITRDQAAAIVEMTVTDRRYGKDENETTERTYRIKLADKRAALVDIGNHLGIFTKKVELTGKDGAPLMRESPRSRIEQMLDAVATRVQIGDSKPMRVINGTTNGRGH